MLTDEFRVEDAVSNVYRRCILMSLLLSIFGCAALEENRIQSEFRACIATLNRDSQYAPARESLDPEGGVTPSMLSNPSHPNPENLEMLAAYLDEKTRCEREWVQQMGDASYGDREKFYVIRKQYRARWQSFANFLTGGTSYGDLFSEQERIKAEKEDQIAEIERRREQAVDQRKASVEEACTAAGGQWTGVRCNPVLGDPNRSINCTTSGGTTTCNSNR